MKKHNQTGFSVIELVIVLVVIGVVGVAALHVSKKTPKVPARGSSSQASGIQEGSGPNYGALARCTDQPIFNTLPTRLADFNNITPLGNINVPDHTLPTDHVYFNFKTQGGGSSVFAPGKIVVTSILNSGEKKDGVQITNDYALTFFGCKGVSFLYGHVEALAGKLAEATKGGIEPCDRRTPVAGEETFYCTKNTDIVLQPGDLMGQVGGKPQIGAFDFGAHKQNYVDPGFAGAKYYPTVNAVCGLDYFEPADKAQLYNLLPRAASPRCGLVGQDKPGTAQGGWFATTNPQSGQNDWGTNLSVVHDNVYPAVGVIGIGGTIGSPMVIKFNPTHTGGINREPSEIKADDTVYCFHNESTPAYNTSQATGKVLLQLSGDNTLKVTQQAGVCSSNETLSSPTTYYR